MSNIREYVYAVPLQPNPSKSDLKAAWRLTVIARADGKCQHCQEPKRLDACHIEPRDKRPDLSVDPENGIALCRSCHGKFDHANGHRPAGRPLGYKLTQQTKQKISEGGRRAKAGSEWRASQQQRSRAMWDQRGRKPERDCENCGASLSRIQLSRDARFCSAACHYVFRVGKGRSGY